MAKASTPTGRLTTTIDWQAGRLDLGRPSRKASLNHATVAEHSLTNVTSSITQRPSCTGREVDVSPRGAPDHVGRTRVSPAS